MSIVEESPNIKFLKQLSKRIFHITLVITERKTFLCNVAVGMMLEEHKSMCNIHYERVSRLERKWIMLLDNAHFFIKSQIFVYYLHVHNRSAAQLMK